MLKFVAAGALLAAAIAPAAAQTTTIDFESTPQGFQGPSLTIGNATFTSNSLYVGPLGNTVEICPEVDSTCAGTLGVSFADPVANLSFQINGADDSNSTLTALVTLVGGSTASYNFTNFVTGSDFNTISFGALSGISSVTLTNDDFYGYGFDNFTFDASAVPEPATWGLMILGFGAVGATLRRRSTKVAYAA